MVTLSNEEILQWIMDPTVKPFTKKITDSYFHIIPLRKNILNTNSLNQPNSLINNIRRKVFYNTSIRKEIIDRITALKEHNVLRLYTMNDKNKYGIFVERTNTNYENLKINYITPHFTTKECEEWVNNEFVDPKTKNPLLQNSCIYIELLYTSIQLGVDINKIENKLYLSSSLSSSSSSSSSSNIYKITKKIINNIRKRLEFINENDELFLKHNIESFDKLLDINTVEAPKYVKPKKSFSVSSNSSLNKSLKYDEKIQLRDMILEKKMKEKEINLYKHHRKLEKKRTLFKHNNKNKNLFKNFKVFLNLLNEEVKNGTQLIEQILRNTNQEDLNKITGVIEEYFYYKGYNESDITTILRGVSLDNIKDVVINYIYYIYAQLINPETFITDEIMCFSHFNQYIYFERCKIINKITFKLNNYIDNYWPKLDDTIIIYFKYIVDDIIPKIYVEKIINDKRDKDLETDDNYKNYYYHLLHDANNKLYNQEFRLPEGMGLLIGKKLRKYLKVMKDIDNILKIDESDLNGYTYKDCQKWVTMPIINPRTFKPILIDSPIYNRLLCISFQYDSKLIPRMITSHGFSLILALIDIIKIILDEEKRLPQTREQLEQYINDKEEHYDDDRLFIPYIIGLAWKSVGAKKPIEGIEIVNKKLNEAFLKSTGRGKDVELPFYVLFSEEAFAKFGATDITKDSYIEISTYYMQVIDNKNKKANNLGLNWKMINNERYKEGMKRGGVEIINKKLKEAILKLASKGNILPSHVSFSKEDLEKFGITTAVPKNRYIKFTYYYKPIIRTSIDDVVNKSNKPNIIRDTKYMIKGREFTFIECLHWVRQPNKIPNTETIIVTDGPEYNNIFEQALLYDKNIQPMGITPLGLHFKKQILYNKKKFFKTTKLKNKIVNNDITASNREDIIYQSEVCKSINNIYTLNANNVIDNKYVEFKEKMLEICDKNLAKDNCNLINIQNKIKKEFVKSNGKRRFLYFEVSALGSIIVDYYRAKENTIAYDSKIKNKFIDNYNIFDIIILEFVYVNGNFDSVKAKEAVDLGGVRREFFTKLFEELFCDDNKEINQDRPFISPENSSSNRYYINPNFKPNKNLRFMLNVLGFEFLEKEEDYNKFYEIIGKVLGIVLVNEELGLPKQLSTYILARFINPKENISMYDILYFYLKDFNDSYVYINMINQEQKEYLNSEDFEYNFNDNYSISKQSKDGMRITTNNFIKFILELSNHIVTKNFLNKNVSIKNMNDRYESLFKGFNDELRTFLYNNQVSIKTLDILITNKLLDRQSLIELAENMKVKIILIGTQLDKKIQKDKIDELRTYMTNIITKKREGQTDAEHYDFIKRLLQYWTGFNYYNKKAEETEGGYKITYIYHGENIKTDNWPEAHTCFYQLDIYGYDDKTTPQEKEDYLYMILNKSINEAPGMQIA